MAWLKNVSSKQIPSSNIEAKVYSSAGMVRKPTTDYNSTWEPERAVREALERVTWVYRSVDAISSNFARQPIVIREGDPYDGTPVKHPLTKIYNRRANIGEDSFRFRYRLSGQLLLSNKGVFIEVGRNRNGDVKSLVLLPPDRVTPIPDAKKFVSGYVMESEDQYGRPVRKTLKPENVIWIMKPHIFNPYVAFTPLQSVGMSVETDWLARLYNRNFLLNDGRPGGMVVIKGEASEETKAELQARFRGGPAMAGRIAVIATEAGADFVDTAVTPRDAQYIESRSVTKEEILMAFGVPESVLSNAGGKTYENADSEREIFWMETMLPHLELIMRPLDVLLGEEGDEEHELYTGYDLSRVDVLRRADTKRKEFHLKEFDAGVISMDEYRESSGRELLPDGLGSVIMIPNTRSPYITTDGSEPTLVPSDPEPQNGRPPNGGIVEEEDEPVEQDNDRIDLLPNTDKLSLEEIEALEFKVIDESSESTDEEVLELIKSSSLEAVRMNSIYVETAMKRLFERESRVVGEKLSGSKMRKLQERRKKHIERNGPISSMASVPHELSVKAAVETIFDIDSWDSQLEEDLMPIFKDIAESAASKAALQAAVPAPDISAIENLAKNHVERLKSIHRLTLDDLGVALAALAIQDVSPEELKKALDPVFESCVQRYSGNFISSVVSSLMSEAKMLPFYGMESARKTWITLKADNDAVGEVSLDGESIPIGDKFTLLKSVHAYPNDVSNGLSGLGSSVSMLAVCQDGTII